MASQSQSSLGALKPQFTQGEYNNVVFAVNQAISKLQTATLVQVQACTNSGDASPVGYVDVLPLVNQIDGNGNPTPHVTVYELPYLRLQGGSNAIIIDPQPGDIGIAIFASRDISKVKATKGQANPGSFRSYDFADGLYLGGVLNGTPTRFIQFSSAGITINDASKITFRAPSIVLDGDANISGTLTVVGDVTGAAISLQHHLHTSATPGQPTSEPIP